jgi:hypothetical protein
MNDNLAIRLAARRKIAGSMTQEEIDKLIRKDIPTFEVGTLTTCQFGNPGDFGWTEEKDGNVDVEILDRQFYEIAGQYVYLVKRVGEEYVGRAMLSVSPKCSFNEPRKLGVLYCTNARTYGERAQMWTGIITYEDAKRSLSF